MFEYDEYTPGIERCIGTKMIDDILSIAVGGLNEGLDSDDETADSAATSPNKNNYNRIMCEGDKTLLSFHGNENCCEVDIKAIYNEVKIFDELFSEVDLDEEKMQSIKDENRKNHKDWEKQRDYVSSYSSKLGKQLDAENIALGLYYRFAHATTEVSINQVNVQLWFGVNSETENVVR